MPGKDRPQNKGGSNKPSNRGSFTPKPQPYKKGSGGRGTTHGAKGKAPSRGAGQTRPPQKSCGKNLFIAIPMTLFWALPRMIWEDLRAGRPIGSQT